MYEVLEFVKDKNYKKRILPIVSKSADSIFSNVGKVNYINFWEEKLKEENNLLKSISPHNSSMIINNINKIEEICKSMGEFLEVITDMKCWIINIENCESQSKEIVNFYISNLSKIISKRVNNYVVNYNELLTYNAVCVFNNDTKWWNIFIPDLCLFIEELTIDNAIIESQKVLLLYFKLSKKYKTEIPIPSSIDVVKEYWMKFED